MESTKWTVDTTHSEIGFKVKHMMFTNVSGKFEDFEAKIESENEDFEGAKFYFTAKSASVNTGNADRDKHLVSPDFFDADSFPEVKFESSSFTKQSNGEYLLKGTLSLHGQSKTVELNTEFGGLMQDPWGNTKAAFSLTGKINRKDFGLNWNAALETGGVLVSDEVRFAIELQFVKE